MQDVVRQSGSITRDARESTFLFQQLSVALQRGNAVSFQNTFTASSCCNSLLHFLNVLVPAGFVLVGHQKIIIEFL